MFPSETRSTFRNTARMSNSTLGLVKPHALKEGKLGEIFAAIYQANFCITAMKMFHLARKNCEEFYEVYKGVVPEYVVNIYIFFQIEKRI